MDKAYLTNDIEDSFFTELDLDEAANICGGGLFGYDPNSLENRHNSANNYYPADNYPYLGDRRTNYYLRNGYELSDITDSAGDDPYLRNAQYTNFGYLYY
jgi:hypothetical protein